MKTKVDRRIAEEKRTVRAMVAIYCRNRHGGHDLCPGCRGLLDYAFARLDHCPQAQSKPTCSRCTIHCYSPGMRGSIRTVMRYSGPRMLLHHPMMALRHLWREIIR